MESIQTPSDVAFWTQRVVLDGRTFHLRGEWNQRASAWFLGLSDQDETVIFSPRKVVADFDLLRQCSDDRRPGGALMAVDTSGEGADPAFGDLGDRVQLVYVSADELAEILTEAQTVTT